MSTTRSRVSDPDNDAHPRPNAASTQRRSCWPPRESGQRGFHRAWRQDVDRSVGPSPAGCGPGGATLDRAEAILRNPAVSDLAALVPRPRQGEGVRPRSHPASLSLACETPTTVYDTT